MWAASEHAGEQWEVYFRVCVWCEGRGGRMVLLPNTAELTLHSLNP